MSQIRSPTSYRSLIELTGVQKAGCRGFFDNTGKLVGVIDTFILPEGRYVWKLQTTRVSPDLVNRGQLHHIQPVSPGDTAEANEVFKAYQEEANAGTLMFKRWPMRSVRLLATPSSPLAEAPHSINVKTRR